MAIQQYQGKTVSSYYYYYYYYTQTSAFAANSQSIDTFESIGHNMMTAALF
jgi:hypothetical protein